MTTKIELKDWIPEHFLYCVDEPHVQCAWEHQQDEIDTLRAENERLHEVVTELGVAHITAQTEVERLRAALEQIADAPTPYADMLRRWAREAVRST